MEETEETEETDMAQFMEQGQKTQGINNMMKSQRLMKSLQKKYSNLLNKSYAFIELKDREAKEKMMNPFLRLFGINVQGLKIQVDDADQKRTLILFNLIFNQETAPLVDHLNSLFASEALDISLDKSQADELIHRGRLYIRFNSLEETQHAFALLSQS